jgi:hypothetical protein
MYKVAVYAPAERADALPLFHLYSYVLYTDKKEIQFSSYIGKFRMEQLQSHI